MKTVTNSEMSCPAHPRHSLVVLGVCLLSLSAMVLGASFAHAETGAKWAIVKADGKLVTISPEGDGKGIGDSLLPQIKVKELGFWNGVKRFFLFTIISKILLHIGCETFEKSDWVMTLTGALAPTTTKYKKCALELGKKEAPACAPHSKGEPAGTITVSKVGGLIKLHSGVPTVLFTPEVGETFVTLVLGAEGESECSVGELLPVSGKFSVEDSGGKASFETETATHLANEHAALTDMWVLNKTAEHKATIAGSAVVELAGEHQGLKWAGLPG